MSFSRNVRRFLSLDKFARQKPNSDGSISINDRKIINSYTSDPDFPFLVSFSRTGSHWLRMVMELYFEKPSLVRIFYFKGSRDFTCYHTHDLDLKLIRENVIYLYRDPIDVVYSQLCYYKQDVDDREIRNYWANLYARHLVKWLYEEQFTRKKTIITYEGMVCDMSNEINKICLHLGEHFIQSKLDDVLEKVSKDRLKEKTKHDPQVVNLSSDYRDKRIEFCENYGRSIVDEMVSIDRRLENVFHNKKYGFTE